MLRVSIACQFIFVLCFLSCSATTTVETTDDETSAVTFDKYCADVKKNATVKKQLYLSCFPYVIGLAKGEQAFETEEVFIENLIQAPDEESYPKTVISFEQLNLLTFAVLNEGDFRPDVQMNFQLTWRDERLKWNPTEWPFRNYPVDLKPNGQIWAPEFSLKGASALSLLVDSVAFYSAKVTYMGNVSVTALAQLTFGKCQIDVAAYPEDSMKCCTDLIMSPADRVIADVNKLTTSWDASMISIWAIKSMELTQLIDGKPTNSLKLCITSKRNTAALGTELSLPMAVSAIVLMCAQLAGKFKMQVYVKLIAILIQVFAFQNLVPNEALVNATRLPRIYLFYNLTVAMTIFSLFQTMLFWALSRRWFLMPPPHRLTLSMKVMSRCLLGDKMEQVAESSGIQQLEPRKTDYRKEWEVVFGTVHAVLSLIIIFCYILGIIIIYASKDY